MTSTHAPQLSSPLEAPALLGKTGRIWLAVLAVLFIALHWHLITRMAMVGMRDPDWSHILVIPAISIYYIFANRARILATPQGTNLLGLPIMVVGVFGFALGVSPIQNSMVQGYSMILTLFGLVLLTCGWRMMRYLWFPILFLFFGIKISDAIWSRVASELQGVAANGSVVLLNLLSGISGVEADIRGNTIDLEYIKNGVPVHKPMNVAEACSGMRMLMAFLALGVAMAFLVPRRWWQRIVILAVAAPVAVFVNVLRVTVLGLVHPINEEWVHGQSHILIGMLMLIPAAGLIMLIGWAMEKCVIGEQTQADPPPLPPEADPSKFEVDWSFLVRAAIIGACAMAAGVVIYLFALNFRSEGKLIEWVPSWMNIALIAGGAIALLGICIALPNRLKSSTKAVRNHRAFGIGFGVLLAAALGQWGILELMGAVLIKEPVECRYVFSAEFPDEVGDWHLLAQDPKLGTDIEDELGTKNYFTRYYVDATGCEVTKEADPNDPNATLWHLAPTDGSSARTISVATGPGGHAYPIGHEGGQVAKLHVAYYTGMVDTVPHVPNKCWVVAGATPVFDEVQTLHLSGDFREDPEHGGFLAPSTFGYDARLPEIDIDASVFSAIHENGAQSTAVYFFVANGGFKATRHHVRFGFEMADRYAYYCKIEVHFPGLNDPEEAVQRTEAFLSAMMPEIMAVLPDWTEVEAGRWPLPEGQALPPRTGRLNPTPTDPNTENDSHTAP